MLLPSAEKNKKKKKMGWIPCSGNSGTKKKMVKMEVQDSVVGQIKGTPGTDFFFLFVVFSLRNNKKVNFGSFVVRRTCWGKFKL